MRVNNQSTGWDQAGHFMASTNFLNQMWLPDIQVCEVAISSDILLVPSKIYMCKQFLKRQIVTDVAGLIIYQNKQVLYTVSTEVIIACPMKFAAYPLDQQLCKFLVKYLEICFMAMFV